jgi:hypothetical protein
MQIPAQEKIAELESRIAALEDWRKEHSCVRLTLKRTRHEGSVTGDGVFGDAWHKMWQAFDEVIKKL